MPKPSVSLQLHAKAKNQATGKRNRHHVRFDTLVAKIDDLRTQIQQWEAFHPQHQQRVQTEFAPIYGRWNEGREAMVLLLDRLLTELPAGVRPLGKVQKNKLTHILCGMASALLEDQPDNTEVMAAFDRHSEVSYAEQAQASREFTREMLGRGMGIDLGEDDPSLSHQDMLDQAKAKLMEQLTEMQQQADAEQEARQAKFSAPHLKKKEQADQEVKQSVREVYRKLASSLHPDRETDPVERERKTALMQKVNQAYDNKDLLTLLTLQIEIEQISAKDLAALPETRLKHYIKVLEEQVAQLRMELEDHWIHYADIEGLSPWEHPTPTKVASVLTADINQIKQNIKLLEQDLKALPDRRYLSAWLKTFQLPNMNDDFEDMLDQTEEMVELLQTLKASAMGAPPKGRGKR